MLGELTRDQIESVLRREAIGRIGCHAEGRTYVVPITYAYDGEYVYGHSSDGLKVRTMRANPDVCFEVEQVDDLACWRSVVAWGTYEELSGADEERAMQLLIDRFAPHTPSEGDGDHPDRESHSSIGTHGNAARLRAIAYRIRLTEKTGRFEQRP